MALIWAEETHHESRRERLSTQACPQSVWEKAEAPTNTAEEEEGAEETSVRGEEEREGGTPIREEHSRRERGERRGERGIIDKREDTTTDDDEEEEEERPHGRLTGLHGRDLADVPRGQVLVEGGGRQEH